MKSNTSIYAELNTPTLRIQKYLSHPLNQLLILWLFKAINQEFSCPERLTHHVTCAPVLLSECRIQSKQCNSARRDRERRERQRLLFFLAVWHPHVHNLMQVLTQTDRYRGSSPWVSAILLYLDTTEKLEKQQTALWSSMPITMLKKRKRKKEY